METEKMIWVNGELCAWDDAKFHVLSHGLHYGYGCFEGIRSYKTKQGGSIIFRLHDHIQRLFNSAKVIDSSIPYSMDVIEQACIDVVRANQLEEGYIRPIAFTGAGSFGVYPANNPVQMVIAAWKWGSYLGDNALQNGIKTKMSTYVRFHPNCAMVQAKITGNYASGVMAKMEAIKQGYDEAILLDTDGFVAEGSGENIFIVENDCIITPPRMAILPGITRDTIMVLAHKLGYRVLEQRFPRDQLYTADEAFFTGTAAEVTPIISVDGRVIANGKPGEITLRLQDAYFKCVHGEWPEQQNWLAHYDLRDTTAKKNNKTNMDEKTVS